MDVVVEDGVGTTLGAGCVGRPAITAPTSRSSCIAGM
jgi:hypothetical protein